MRRKLASIMAIKVPLVLVLVSFGTFLLTVWLSGWLLNTGPAGFDRMAKFDDWCGDAGGVVVEVPPDTVTVGRLTTIMEKHGCKR